MKDARKNNLQELNLEEMETVSGGTPAQIDELSAYIRAHNPELFADAKFSPDGTKINTDQMTKYFRQRGIPVAAARYNYGGENVYYINDNGTLKSISHADFMQMVYSTLGK